MAKSHDPEPEHETTSEEEGSGTETEPENEATSEEEESGTETESESEPEQTPALTTGLSEPSKTQPSTPQQPQTNLEEDSESESGSESEESSDAEAPSQTEPVVAVQKPTSVKKPASIQASSSKTSTPTLTGTKRAAEVNGLSDKDAKKGKNNDTLIGMEKVNDPKKPLFQRIWSNNDEIVLLRGILDYVEEKNADPCAEINSFYDSIKKKLQVTVSKEQLKSKIRALKKKFWNNQSKEVDGEDRVFSKPHEHQSYQLSKKIWGNADMEISVGTPRPISSRQVKTKKEKNLSEQRNGVKPDEVAIAVKTGADCHTVQKFPNFGTDMETEEMIQRRGRELFEGGKGVEGSEAWKNCRLRQMEIYMETLKLKMDMTKLVFDATKSGNL